MYVYVQAHVAIAECESRLKEQGRRVVTITQNIDELHARAGSKNIIELHGTLIGDMSYIALVFVLWRPALSLSSASLTAL